MISINNNLPALNVAHTLNGHYGRLQTSTQRLSSGLRINGSADDAAGLAIRELMRANIAALNQGVRNANDAISMLQTFDGALSVIDEKLIRMKELAEQAATGTYDSTQRLMIDSEFQAMGAEINRIANATDFNGIKLLCTPMKTWFTEENRFVVTNPGSIENLMFNGQPQMARGITRATINNLDANKYINQSTPSKTITVNLTAEEGTKISSGKLTVANISADGLTTSYSLGNSIYKATTVATTEKVKNPVVNYDATSTVPWTINDDTTSPSNPTGAYNSIDIDPAFPIELNAMASRPSSDLRALTFSLTDKNDNPVDLTNIDPNIVVINVDTKNNTYKIGSKTVEINADTADYTASYNEDSKTVTVKLKSPTRATDATVTIQLDAPLEVNNTIDFDITMEGDVKPVQVEHHEPDPNMKFTIHFGPMNDSAEDYYNINYQNCTLEGLELDDVDIQTQDNAQNALVDINEAIVKKDKIRAYFGAMQNRLENTATNLRIQSENLQNAESRISDAQIATEMMEFVRNQILSNSAVAMLAQANSMPQMVMALIH